MILLSASPFIRALCRHGRHADVQLLARLGPQTALIVSSVPYRNPASADIILEDGDAFSFFCDSLERANSTSSLINEAVMYATHLCQIIKTDIPVHVYLFIAAIEIGLVKICEDLINYWTGSKETIKEMTEYFSQSALQDRWSKTYRIDPALLRDADASTLAEFLLGRATVTGANVKDGMLRSAVFSRNITAYHIDKALATAHQIVSGMALKASFLPVSVKKIAIDNNELDPEKDTVVRLTEESKKMANDAVHGAVRTCASVFVDVQTQRDKIGDIVAASTGDIKSYIHYYRVKYVEELPDNDATAWRREKQEAFNKLEENMTAALDALAPAEKNLLLTHISAMQQTVVDPDDDIDDK